MPQLTYPDQPTIDSWNVREAGIRAGDSSPSEEFEVDHSGAERVFRVKWAYRDAFVKYMLGYAQTWDDAGTTRLSRLLPRTHPDYPDLIAARVTSIKGHKYVGDKITTQTAGFATDPTRNFGHPGYQWTDGQVNLYQDAIITVAYEHASYLRVEDATTYADSIGEFDRYVSRDDTQPSAEALQLPGAVMSYVAGTTPPNGTKIPFSTSRVIAQERFTLTWHRLPQDVWATNSNLYQRIYVGDNVGGKVVPYLGTVNRADFYGRPKGTLLFESVRPVLQKSPLGSGWEWQIEYSFVHKPTGWLNLYYFDIGGSGAANGYYFVSADGTSYTADTLPDDKGLYNTRDHNLLFSVN